MGTEPKKTFEFRCACCGEVHSGSPSFGYEKPPMFFDIPEPERDARIEFTSDTCVIDDDTFFIRGLLEIPIIGVEEPFSWGLWVSQSAESFERYLATYDQDQSGETSFGWLMITMPGYNRSPAGEYLENLACDVVWRSEGDRPLIAPHESDHPLYEDFVQGISWDKAIDLAQRMMHPE